MSSHKGCDNLLSLPVEIIQQIATFCPCSTVFNLLLVNSQLHATCNHKFVFEQLARRTHINEAISAEVWSPEKLFDRASLSDAARIAYAVEKACQWAKDPIPLAEEDPKSSTIPQWLPQLAALNHPASTRANAQGLLRLLLNLYVTNPLGPDLRVIQFCYAITLLSTRPKDKLSSKDTFRSIFCEENIEEGTFSSLFAEKLELDTQHSQNGPETVFSGHPMAVVIALAAALVQRDDSVYADAPLPEPRCIPFQSFMEISLIRRNTSEAFSKCHLELMTSPEFLSSGDWVGVYNYGYRLPRIHSRFGLHDAPMLGIHFDCEWVAPTALGEKTLIAGSSVGRDGVGEFRISGGVYEDGLVRLRKDYIRMGMHWDWRGYVTPLGIAGLWGSEGTHFGGYFWIWKLEWCQSH